MKWYLETSIHALVVYGGIILTVTLPVIGSIMGIVYLVRSV